MSDDTPPSSSGTPLLVFGDDGSPGADVAWLWVCDHPWTGWRIEAVTARESEFPPPAEPAPRELEERSPPWGRPRCQPEGVASLRFVSAPGDPRAVLAERGDADLVVVGPRGLRHLRALWLGSTTEWLLHHPPAPLALIRSAALVHRAVVCVDGSPHSQAATDAYLRLPLAAGAEVTVLCVDDGRTDVEAATRGARAAFGQAGQTADVVLAKGRPTHAILEHLDEHRPGLVVLGTRGLTGLARLRLGSTGSGIARAATCSALLATAAGDDET